MSNPELTARNPDLAKLLHQMRSQFDRAYDFGRVEDQATFAEGMRELGRHCALNSANGRLSIGIGANGIVSVSVTLMPRE